MTAEKDIIKASAGVRECLADLDVEMVGVVAREGMKEGRLAEQAERLLPGVNSIVVMAVEVYPEFLDLTSPEKEAGAPNMNDLYDRHIDRLAGRLDRAAYVIARASHRAGLKALPLPARRTPTDLRTLTAVLSYKHAAEAAGLGKIGMNSLVVTGEYGPRIRLGVCLTEALLDATASDIASVCRYCNICVAKCPAGALGYPKKSETYVINKFACREYCDASGGCSECVKQCPAGSDRYA